MKKIEALKFILSKMSDREPAVFCNGITSREGFMIKDRPLNFYMLGSMGHAAMIGLGIAQNVKSRVYVFDGDGNFFMNISGSAMIGAEKPSNLVHIIFDNKEYQTTGGQKTISTCLDIAKIGQSLGYSYVKTIKSMKELKKEFVKWVKLKEGPIMLVIKVEAKYEDKSRVIPLSPQEMVTRFRENIGGCKNED